MLEVNETFKEVKSCLHNTEVSWYRNMGALQLQEMVLQTEIRGTLNM